LWWELLLLLAWRVFCADLEPRYSSCGYLVPVWRWPLFRIKPHFLESVIYLYPSVKSAKSGEQVGGSGFLVGVRSTVGKDAGYLYAVTNKHVVEDGKCRTIRLNKKSGGIDPLETSVDDWTRAPADDLAVMLLPLDDAVHQFSFIPEDTFITDDIIEKYDLGAGDDTFLVGRFVNHEGKQRNTPSVRFGNISMMPSEPIRHPHGYDQESFLVEIRSVSGYSGSPVFVFIPPSDVMYRRTKEHSCGPWLLGVDWGHTSDWHELYEEDRKTEHPAGLGSKLNTGMAQVIPAWRLRKLLDDDDLMNQRKKLDKELKKEIDSSGVVLDVAKQRSKDFTRSDFESALKKVSRKLPLPKNR
jgi:hypothetical protein